MENLLLEIISCPNFINGPVEGHPCCEILRCQDQYVQKQVPEPWNGNIETAKILFLSSNPSIGENENYPTFCHEIGKLSQSWTEDSTANFFVNRFSIKYPYVKDYLYPQQITGEYKAGWVRFWAAVRSMATVILGRAAIPGDDYAIAEIVRCKSKSEQGVALATDECVKNFLDRTVRLAGAKIIICLGKKVRLVIEEKYKPQIISAKSEGKENEICQIQIGDRKVMLLFLPHPNAHQKRNISILFGDKLDMIRNSLR